MTSEEAYRNGYKEGFLIGTLTAELDVTRLLMKKYNLESYEACFQIFECSEVTIARLMDYLPVNREQWRIPSKEETDTLLERIKAISQSENKQYEKKKKRLKKMDETNIPHIQKG